MMYFNGKAMQGASVVTLDREWQKICEVNIDVETAQEGITTIEAAVDIDCSEFTEFNFILQTPNIVGSYENVAFLGRIGDAMLFYTKNEMTMGETYTIMGTAKRIGGGSFCMSMHGHGKSEFGYNSRQNILTEYSQISNPLDNINIRVVTPSNFTFPAGTSFYIEGRK